MSTKLRCLLLDDELPGLAYLKMICGQMQELEIVKAFNNPLIFLREIPNLQFDLCIIDIEMPGINGLQVASQLEGKMVIFTTAYKEYAAEAFDINAIDYVRKPVQSERLHQAILKALSRKSQQPAEREFVQLNSDKGKSLIYFDQIQYCTVSPTDSRDKLVYLSEGTQLTLKNISFEKLMEMMPHGLFCRLNKRDLISIRLVQSYSHDEVVTTTTFNGQVLRLPLSDSYRKEFLRLVQPQ